MVRRNFEDGMEITYGDLNKISSSQEKQYFDRVLKRMMLNDTDAFFGTSFSVSRVSATQVRIAAGVGFQTDGTVTTPEPTYRMLYLGANSDQNISTPDASNPRIDIVCVKAGRASTSSATRKFKSADSSTITDETLVVETDWEASVSVVAGTPAGSPSAPAIPSGYIKIAELTVSATTGIAASGAITDTRELLPVGEDIWIDTSAYSRLPAGVNTKLSALFEDIDSKIGGGGGGGAGLVWTEPGGFSPLSAEEHGQKVYLYDDVYGKDQKLVVSVRVPTDYVAGTQINMTAIQYSPSSDSSDQLLKSRCYLVRPGTDAIGSTTNLHTSTNTVQTSDTANTPKVSTLDLTDGSGEINSVAVAAGNILRIELFRDTDTDDDTADVRFIPSMTSVSFT